MPKTLDCLREEGFTLSMMPFRTTAENLARYFSASLPSRVSPCPRLMCTKRRTTATIYRA